MRQTVKVRRGIRRIAVTVHHRDGIVEPARSEPRHQVLTRREALAALRAAGVRHQGLLSTAEQCSVFYF